MTLTMKNMPDDILWTIFTINSMDGLQLDRIDRESFGVEYTSSRSYPLNVARLSSQVCRNWRRILLSSPRIWANLVDLKALSSYPTRNRGRTIWLNRILDRGRTGFAIYGNICDKAIFSAVVQLLQTRWTEIRILNVKVFHRGKLFKEPLISTLNSVSPTLEYFSITTNYLPGGNVAINSQNPNLRYLHIRNHSILPPLSNGAPFFQSIRHLNFGKLGESSYLTSPFQIQDFLDLLAHLPLLEVLSIQCHIFSPYFRLQDIEAKPRLSLPRLRYIGLCSPPAISSILLHHIEPASQCGIELELAVVVSDTSGSLIPLAKLVKERYASGLVIQFPFKVELSPHGSFQIKHEAPDCDPYLHSHFSIHVIFFARPPGFSPLKFINACIFDCDFTRLQTIQFSVEEGSDKSLNPDISVIDLQAFFQLLSPAVVLQINWAAFHLSSQNLACDGILPSLRKVKFFVKQKFKYYTLVRLESFQDLRVVVDKVLNFCLKRRQVGLEVKRPVFETLDIECFSAKDREVVTTAAYPLIRNGLEVLAGDFKLPTKYN